MDDFVTNLADAIYHWLNYMVCTSNSTLLAESSIRYPLAEYLERKRSAKVKLEVAHPLFEYRRLDFAYKRDEGANVSTGYIELKLVSSATSNKSEIQRIFNDLIRLGFQSNHKVNYFILCGNLKDFALNFKSIRQKPKDWQEVMNHDNREGVKAEGPYKDWFPFVMGETITFKPSDFDQFSVFNEKDDYGYKWRKEVNPKPVLKKVNCRLEAARPLNDKYTTSQCVYIWKVWADVENPWEKEDEHIWNS